VDIKGSNFHCTRRADREGIKIYPEEFHPLHTVVPKGAEPHPSLNFGFSTGLFSRDVFESFGSLEGGRRGKPRHES
jgi:hypothetical protein